MRRRTAVDDQRAKQVALTAEGRQLVESMLTNHGEQITRVMGGLSETQQVHMGRLLTKLGGHLAALAHATPGGDDLSESD